ncbi:MAG TPA: hypothetical protein VKN36_18560 [Eudoraea sp.]|nr:hypothetical protein [Eudoraea sp.]
MAHLKPDARQNKFLFFLLVIWILSPLSAQGQETWTLEIEYRFTANTSGMSADVRARGNARIQADAQGVFSGSGTMTAEEEVSGKDVKGSTRGAGPFSISGRRQGKYLIFTVKASSFPLTGTINAAGMTLDHKSSFDPSACTPAKTALERKEGKTISNTLGQPGTANINATASFTLADGVNILKAPPAKIAAADKGQELWTLSLTVDITSKFNNKDIQYQGTDVITGLVKFAAPEQEGRVEGEGPVDYQSHISYTRPMVTQADIAAEGLFILNGQIKNDSLRFIPRSILNDVQVDNSLPAAHFQSAGQGIWWFNQSEVVVLPFENKARLDQTISGNIDGVAYEGNVIWTLQGKKKERWRISIDDHHLNLAISSGGGDRKKHCGLKVHTRRIIDISVENGQFAGGKGRAAFVSIGPYSDPSWAYKSESSVGEIIGSGTDVEAERYYQVRKAKRFNPPVTEADKALRGDWSRIKKNKTPFLFPEEFTVGGAKSGTHLRLQLPQPSGYTLQIHCRLNSAEVEKRGYTISPNEKKDATAIDRYVLGDNFEVQLIDGWTYADAPSDAVDRTMISVNKL